MRVRSNQPSTASLVIIEGVGSRQEIGTCEAEEADLGQQHKHKTHSLFGKSRDLHGASDINEG
jgi:hypothetical protein